MKDAEAEIRARYEAVAPYVDERARRLILGAEANVVGRGGIALVTRATGASPNTVARGLAEVRTGELPPEGRVRKAGAGRKRASDKDATLLTDLDALVEPTTRGDPECPLRWTSKSTRRLAQELRAMGHQVTHHTVARLLSGMGYSLQANAKVIEGGDHPDRDAQFQHVASAVGAFQRAGEPVISVDAKKKELVGNFKNAGREWMPEGEPERVNVYDFVEELGRATPYGVYDIARNEASVNVGTDHDTAEFAVHSIRRWWQTMGLAAYPEATKLLITADGGGSNSSRGRLWKFELQAFANEAGLDVHVCHFPPGTSKWNKIEHRLFSFISQNWRGRPLTSHEVIVNLVASTTTKSGLTVQAAIDTEKYEKGRKITDAQMKLLNLTRDVFHGDWNYLLTPDSKKTDQVI